MKRALTILALLVLATPACAQGGGAAAAARGTAETSVGGKKITITYGRPELKGRDLLAQAPVGFVWRLGKDQATEITSEADLDVGGTTVKAGKYSLWVKRVGEKEWHLCFHPKTGVWGAPELKEGYIAELPLTETTGAKPVEVLNIGLSDAGGKAHITIEWGTFALAGDIEVK